MFNVIHHAPQQLEEVFPHRMTKEESLHEIFMAAIDRLQIGDTLLRNSEAMKVNIRSSNTLEVCKIKVIGLGLVESGKEGNGLTHRVRNDGKIATNFKPKGRSHLSKRRT